MPHRRPPALPLPLRAVLLVVAGLACGTAPAQSIWKSVGPDGKTVFSDHPPAVAGSAAVVNRPPSRAPVVHPVDRPPPAEAGPAPSRGAASGTDAAGDIDPSLMDAVVAVLTQRDVLPRVDELCTGVDPAARDRWHASAVGWKQRNAQYVSQAERVLAIAVPVARRATVTMTVEASAMRLVAPGAEGAPAARRRWCEDTAARVNEGGMDLRNRTEWVDPLMSYQAWR